MKHLFLPYELALKAKEKGFDFDDVSDFVGLYARKHNDLSKICAWSIFEWDTNQNSQAWIPIDEIHAPLYQQIIDWFIEKHFIYIHVSLDSYSEPYLLVPELQQMDKTRTYVFNEKTYGHFSNTVDGKYEALNKAIEEAFKLI